ncbi:serine hydrolase domain-containing protein, partial [Nocardioides sp.]|uniref:serine hydrolase domain-containing protein n=1 Tax=Nocardioides sp. TaxID=35761 RepID=UPI002B273F7E
AGSGAVAGPGAYFHYSNLGYGLLGEVVARLRGAPWWSVVQERLLEPLVMTRTTYGPTGAHALGQSVGHFTGLLHPEPHTDTGAMAPAGQLWSTLADLATWTTVLAGRRPEHLSAATAVEMTTPRADSGYGLGLRLVEVNGARWVGHSGSMPGFIASLFVDPLTAEATIALCNATTGLEAERVPAALLGGTPPEASGWQATTDLPVEAEPLLGVWFWGNLAVELRWNHDVLEVRALQSAELMYTFGLSDGRFVGLTGYHRGETLHVHPTHLECATFVYTREPDVHAS